MLFSFRKRGAARSGPGSQALPAAAGHSGGLHRIRRARPSGLRHLASQDLAQELLHRIQSGGFSADDSLVHLANEIQLELDRNLDVIQNRFGTKRLLYLFGNFHFDLAHLKPPIEGKTYVELGAGSQHPFGLLFLFVALGARRGIALDLDELQDQALAARALAACVSLLLVDPRRLVGPHLVTVARVLENLASFDLGRLHAGDAAGIDPARLCFRRESVFATSLGDGEADVVLSNAFLEHVPRMDEAVAEIARITKKGGLGLHNLDAVDHRSYAKPDVYPLAFLEIESREELVHSCNRLRPRQFVKIFERHGFEVLEVHPYVKVPLREDQRKRFAEPFRSMPIEDLEVTQARLCVRRL